MVATGLSTDPTEYRARLAEQTEVQIDAWAAELMRDVAIRRGVIKVVDDFRREGKELDSRIGVRATTPTARPAAGGRYSHLRQERRVAHDEVEHAELRPVEFECIGMQNPMCHARG